MLDSKELSFFKNILITTVLLSSPCFLITIFFTKSGIGQTLGHILILVILFFLAQNSYRNTNFTPTQRKVMLYYFAILFYLAVIWNYQILFSGSPRNVFRVILVGPLLMIIMNSRKFNYKKFTNFFISVAFILAGLSIIQYFGYQYNLVSLKPATLGPSVEGLYVGIGGYFNLIELKGGIFNLFYRLQGFFSEPANFAQFLMVPLFLSLYKCINKKTPLNLIKFLTIALAFFLTFSVANFFGFLCGILIFFLLKMKNPQFHKSLFNLKIMSLASGLLIFYGTLSFYHLTNQYSRDEAIFSKNTARGITSKLERNKVYFSRILEYPLGDINYKHEYSSNPGFLGHVGLTGGFPLIYLMFLLLFNYFFSMFKVMKKSKYLLVYVGFIAYFIPALWDAKFYEHYFLFLIALFTTFMKNDMAKNKIIN